MKTAAEQLETRIARFARKSARLICRLERETGDSAAANRLADAAREAVALMRASRL